MPAVTSAPVYPRHVLAPTGVSGLAAVPAPPRGRGAALLAAALLLLFAAANLDLLSGRSVPFYRDLGTTQRPARALYASLGPASTIPAISFGQPYLGNPNFLLAYPAPKGPRLLGAHLLLHLALGAAGAFLFFRRLVRSPEAALLGALAFSLSGYVVSSTAFLNATTTIAWIPWLLLAVEASREARGRRFALCLAAVAAAVALLVLAGEPALGLVGLCLAAASASSGKEGTRARALSALLGGGALATLLVSPWIVEVVRASAFSSRRARGFSWPEFAAVGFHPLRLLETPFPLVWGDPTRLVAGGFWGFSVTQGNPPYVSSQAFGLVPFALALLFVLSPKRAEGRGRTWIAVAGVSLAVAGLPWIPGARGAYEALPALHALRYPGKAMLAFGFALAALAALGADRLLAAGALPRFRRRASWGTLASAFLFAGTAVAGRLAPSSVLRLLESRWDPSWASPPAEVLGPVVERLPLQAALAATILLLVSIELRREAEVRSRLLLATACAAELAFAGRTLLPRIPASWVEARWPLPAAAASLGGRVFERTGKDLDAVRRGLFGPAPTGDARSLALAQLSQGWALSGAPAGLRYAWDPDPDGSYSLLTRFATDVVVSRDWPRRLKWLRAAGVASVIASDVPPGTAGLAPLLVESRAGVPATLYRVEGTLPGVRRAGRVLGSRSVDEAVRLFEEEGFDPATDAVVAGVPPLGVSPLLRDASAYARVVAEGADFVVVESRGDLPGVVQVDRTFTPRAKATVDGKPARVLAAQVHLVAVPVPSGTSRVRVDLAP